MSGGWQGGIGTLAHVAAATQDATAATAQGWTANLISFSAVYVVARVLWLRIDSTRLWTTTGRRTPGSMVRRPGCG